MESRVRVSLSCDGDAALARCTLLRIELFADQHSVLQIWRFRSTQGPQPRATQEPGRRDKVEAAEGTFACSLFMSFAALAFTCTRCFVAAVAVGLAAAQARSMARKALRGRRTGRTLQ